MCSNEHEHSEINHVHGSDYVHEHTHTHADGTTHTHSHAHEHTHADGTTHTHTHSAASSPEEALALLTYMLSHNRHHAEELHDLAHCFDEVAGDLIHEAVDKLEESNSLIEQALSLVRNQ